MTRHPTNDDQSNADSNSPLTRYKLAQEIENYLAYIKTIPGADSFSVTMAETVLKGIATWLMR